jgi:hypothetical protein
VSQEQKRSAVYLIRYFVEYSGTQGLKSGHYIHPNMHPREDQILRQIVQLEPNLAEAEYLAVEVQINSANLGYKPYFGLDNSSLRTFVSQLNQFT